MDLDDLSSRLSIDHNISIMPFTRKLQNSVLGVVGGLIARVKDRVTSPFPTMPNRGRKNKCPRKVAR